MIKNKRGIDRVVYNFQKITAGVFMHKQIELLDGMIFMRMKKRPAVYMSC